MRIFIRTIVWLWAEAAMVHVTFIDPGPWWVRIGAGLAGGGTAAWLLEAIVKARTPKPARKGYPTTPR